MTQRRVRGEGGIVQGRGWRGVFVLLVVAMALLAVVVPAGGAWDGAPGAPSAVDGTGTEINVPIFPMLAASGWRWFYSGAPGTRATNGVPALGWPVPDVGGSFAVFVLGLDRRCVSEQPWPFWTMTIPFRGVDTGTTMDDCWQFGIGGVASGLPLGGTTFGWKFAPTAIGSDGTTPVVFDHVNLSNVAPMQPVAGQTTAGTPGYCRNGERGIQTNGGDNVIGNGYLADENGMPPWNVPGYPNESPAYQVYVNPVTGVGMDTTFQAVYEPASPDTSPPQITFSKYFDCESFEQNSTAGSKDGAVGGNYDFSCTDPGYGLVFGPTGIQSCTARVNGTPVLNGGTIDTSTRGDFTLTVTATDGAGNEHQRSATYHVVDDIPPTLDPSLSATPPFRQGQGVTLSANGQDHESGLASSGCDPVDTSTIGDHTATCTATDEAGNTASAQVSYSVLAGDTTPPTANPTQSPAANGNGWNTSDVTVSWNWSDEAGGSGIDTANCTTSSPSSGEGTIVLNASCKDLAGNTGHAPPYTVKVDKTKPTVTCPSPIPTFTFGSTGTQVTASVSDTASGAASTSVSVAAPATTVGANSVNVTGQDKAGNERTVSCSYSVTSLYTFTGFFQPVDNLPTLNSVKAGQAIPVKFSLGGNRGLNVLASNSPQSQQITCNSNEPVDAIEETMSAGNSSLSYDTGTNTYTYTWKTDKAWANTCRQLVLTLSDGTSEQANFKLAK